uniref:Uncharacterized protein n=1 Tax=Eutreptiella gymnastica TaxID=73025 RepID=A0A7S1J5U9_9EUGL
MGADARLGCAQQTALRLVSPCLSLPLLDMDQIEQIDVVTVVTEVGVTFITSFSRKLPSNGGSGGGSLHYIYTRYGGLPVGARSPHQVSRPLRPLKARLDGCVF